MRRIQAVARFVALAVLAVVAVGWGDAHADSPPGAMPFRVVIPGVVRAESLPIVRLAAVGDIMLGRTIGQRLEVDGAGAVFGGVLPFLADADITVGNLECAISVGAVPEPKAFTFAAPAISAHSLSLAGFDVVALANNHSMDYGIEGLNSTLSALASESILSAGAGMSTAAANAPVVAEREGIRFAFLAFADVPIEYGGFDTASWEATVSTPGIAWLRMASMRSSVAQAHRTSEVVVVFLHFGIEGDSYPTADQVSQAHAAIDSGASLVVGSHPHVVQPIEEYHGGLIAYSLGNFVFDLEEADAETVILLVDFSPEGLSAWWEVPARIDSEGLPTLR